MPLPRLRAAVANGDWNNPSTWNDGVVPNSLNDVVALNNFNVTVNQDINIYQLTNFQLFYTSYNSFALMTSNTDPAGKAESSFNDFRSFYPFSLSGTTVDVDTTLANPLWYSYEYPNQELVVINRYSFGTVGNHVLDPKDWKLQGWNATTQLWQDLDSQVNQTTYGSTYLSGILTNTVAYSKYRIIIFQVRNGYGSCRMQNIRFYEKNTYYGTATSPRGTADVNASRNITIGAGNLRCANFHTLMRFSSPLGSVINFNGKIEPPSASSATIHTVEITGSGTYNFTGELVVGLNYSGQGANTIRISQACTLNFYGNVYGNGTQGNTTGAILIAASGSTVNIFGDVEGGNGLNDGAIVVNSASNLNVYGNVYGTRPSSIQYGTVGIICYNSGANILIVGNVVASSVIGTGGQGVRSGMIVNNANRVEITGNIIAGTFYITNPSQRFYGLFIGSVTTLSIIGTIQASQRESGLISSATPINFEQFSYNYQLSGPFISGPTGILPFRASSFKLISNIGNYYQFRDLNLNSTSMVSPNTMVDVPSPQNVRQGTSYGSGNYVGSLAVPPTNRVSLGIPVDNTVGTAVLTADDVWNAQTSAMNTAGSIGKRLKNAATVDSTGDQLSALL